MSWVHAVIFEVVPKYCNSDCFADYEGYSIFSIGSLPTVVDKWSSELNSPFLPISVHWFLRSWCLLLPILLDHVQFTSNYGHKILGSYAILFFAASYLTFIPRHIHNWASFPIRSSCFILLRLLVVLLCSSPVAYWTASELGDSSFRVISFCPLIQFMRSSWQIYWGGMPASAPVDHILSELPTMNRPTWVALHGMAHRFIELHKPLCHNKAVIHEEESYYKYLFLIFNHS